MLLEWYQTLQAVTRYIVSPASNISCYKYSCTSMHMARPPLLRFLAQLSKPTVHTVTSASAYHGRRGGSGKQSGGPLEVIVWEASEGGARATCVRFCYFLLIVV